MTTTPHLDRAILAADNARQGYQEAVREGKVEDDCMEEERYAACALIDELMQDVTPDENMDFYDRYCLNRGLALVRRRAGLESEG